MSLTSMKQITLINQVGVDMFDYDFNDMLL